MKTVAIKTNNFGTLVVEYKTNSSELFIETVYDDSKQNGYVDYINLAWIILKQERNIGDSIDYTDRL